MTTNVLASAQVVATFASVQFLWGLGNARRSGIDPAVMVRSREQVWKIVLGGIAGLASLTYVPIGEAWRAVAICLVASTAIQLLRSIAHRYPRAMTALELAACSIIGLAFIALYSVLPTWRIFWPQETSQTILVVCVNVTFASFLVAGGSQIVRGVLELCGTLPKQPSLADLEASPTFDQDHQLRTGRYIGVLERLIVYVFAYFGSYEAIGFLGAAKGLVRSKRFDEDREFAEYFLVGTLTSIALAVLAAVAARGLISICSAT